MDVLFDILDEERKNRNKVPFFRVKRGLLLILCVHFFTTMSAQTDTTIIIKVVEVAATNIEKDGMGSVIQSFEAKTLDNYRGQALSQLLSEQGNIFIKSYGANTLATISMRGTGSNHTAVLWNGLNLQSSMNGSVDFNLVPVFFLEKIDLQKGGSSARYGSGAIGGSLHLNSYKKPENGWHGAVGGSLGSFEKVEALGKLSFAKENWNSTIKVINREAENDFPLLKNPNQKQTNAHFEQQGITNDNYLKINEKQFLKSFFWYQNVQRQIPPTRSEGASNAQQNDEFLRAGMEWSRVGDSDATKAKVAYLQDKLLFFSDMVDSANSLTKTAIVELEQDFYLKNSVN